MATSEQVAAILESMKRMQEQLTIIAAENKALHEIQQAMQVAMAEKEKVEI